MVGYDFDCKLKKIKIFKSHEKADFKIDVRVEWKAFLLKTLAEIIEIITLNRY
jgi:hypothetical protein